MEVCHITVTEQLYGSFNVKLKLSSTVNIFRQFLRDEGNYDFFDKSLVFFSKQLNVSDSSCFFAIFWTDIVIEEKVSKFLAR